MKPHDLMIGNYLKDQLTGALLETAVLTETEMHFKVIDRAAYPLPDGWKAVPIPITPDWLNIFEFGMLYEVKIKRGEGSKYWDYCRSAFIKRIEYIHELQNIHFLVTGNKLTLK